MRSKEEYPFSITDLHTTPLGIERIRRNLNLEESVDVVELCRSLILEDLATFERRGKNRYVTAGQICITINANRNTIITAHKV